MAVSEETAQEDEVGEELMRGDGGEGVMVARRGGGTT